MNSELERYFCEKFHDEIREKYLDRYKDFSDSFADWSGFIATEDSCSMEEEYLTYVIFGFYAGFIAKRINSGRLTDDLLKDFLDIVNEMAATCDPEIINLLQVGIFESPLVESAKCIRLMRKVLKEELLELYDIIAFHFGNRKYLPYKALKVKPASGENIIVYVKHRRSTGWYVTVKEYWYLDLERYNRENSEIRYSDRFFIHHLDNYNAPLFLETIDICRAEPEELRAMMKEEREELGNLQDYLPSLYVDFDEKLLLSQYPGAIAFERYLPQGWKGSYEPFMELVAAGDRYWLDGGEGE